MKVEVLSLCDFAQADPAGKLTIVGSFDRIHAAEEPITRSVFAIAARLRFEIDEEGTKSVALSLVDSDGGRVMPGINAKFPVKVPQGESTASVNFVMLIPKLSFPKFGDYQLDLSIDSKIEAIVPLYVRQRPAASQQGFA